MKYLISENQEILQEVDNKILQGMQEKFNTSGSSYSIIQEKDGVFYYVIDENDQREPLQFLSEEEIASLKNKEYMVENNFINII